MKFILIAILGFISVIQSNFLAKKLENLQKLQNKSEDYPHDQDLNTFSNYKEVIMTHFSLYWNLDFNQQKVAGNVALDMVSQMDKLEKVNLDLWDQEIFKVLYYDEETTYFEVDYSINIYKEEGEQGQQLEVKLPLDISSKLKKGSKFNLKIYYQVGNSSKSLSFLTKEQTSSQKEPYLFSQCEPIYARSMAILQDTPQIKATYTASVVADAGINVYMSANKTGIVDLGDVRVHNFDNSIPIPSYLLAIIAGNVEEQKVGNRTYVIAEPDVIEKCAKDLEDLEEYLITIENYIQIPYVWGSYKIVIMPPSFPIGGMENPLLTFASPSIITGDKSGTSVAIHEIAHSWTGNMITCGNWSSLWLNEGFTVFLERKAQEQVYGHEFMVMDSIVGNNSFLADVAYFGPEDSFSSLFPDVAHRNPDDAFSTVPYDKGYQFLFFIQHVIGDDIMQGLLNSWVATTAFQSRVWEDFQEFTEQYIFDNCADPQELIDQIDWKVWVTEPGMGPIKDIEQIEFSTPLQANAIDLAQAFIDGKGIKRPENWADEKEFTPNQVYIFIGHLYDNMEELNVKTLEMIEDCYGWTYSNNMEVQWRWFEVTIYVGYEAPKDEIHTFLGQIGRQKMITPQYKAYVATDQRDYAIECFEQYRDFYHPIARITIEQILGL